MLDPQGRAVHHALDGLGFEGVRDVRVGRTVELDVAEGTTETELDEMCRKLPREHGDRELPHREGGLMGWRAVVVTFPGSNCDRDLAVALERVSGVPAIRVWHGDAELPERLDFIALPGGFSYGDYLRSGAMAAVSPVMRAVIAAAERGVPVLGVCNGFQVLTEARLLPGALMRNERQTFVCRDVGAARGNQPKPVYRGL